MSLLDLGWMYDRHRMCSQRDEELWKEAVGYGVASTQFVDDDGKTPIPYGSGPHCVKAFRLFVKTHAPGKLFEIGFNTGVSSSIFLHIGVPNVVSCDVRDTPQVLRDAEKVTARWPSRFRFHQGASRTFDGCCFDAAYVDGDHGLEAIIEDIAVCRRIGVTKFLFDDIFPMHGYALEAVQQSGMTVDWICGNMMACTDEDRSGFLKF